MQQKVFEKLFENYLQNTISEAEQQKLMKMIQQGNHDDFVKEKIRVLLNENENAELLDKQKGDDILTYILSQSSAPKVIPINDNKKSYRRSGRTIVAIAAAITILFAIRTAFVYENTPDPVKTNQEKTEKVSSVLAFNGKQLIRLPDGSTIILNDKSSITYDQNDFDKETREVTLSGEAYFDIKRNEKKPFIVHTGKVSTRVLGTAFNINAYDTSDNIEVTVERGKVQVGDTKKIYGVITPNQQIKVNKNTLDFEQNNTKIETVITWKSNYLILDDLNMEDAVAMISQKYKVSILLGNDKIKKCRITASFLNEEDLDHVLKVVCSVIETTYHYNQNNAIVLEGKGCE
ncbi:FecR family protein [Flavobacterium sp. FlaQc-48]|uniref:FecR family protein n=1 Tax=Flavobacterium sp. FlaQc-48 TaxID=3374181 RepID=UPI00375839CF